MRQKSSMKLHLLGCLILLTASQARSEDMSIGQRIIETTCAQCHAIGKTGTSPNPKSPPFRAIVNRYPSDTLVEALTDQTSIAHGEMPEFVLEPEDIAEMTEYLETLRSN
jgi:cytochrome c